MACLALRPIGIRTAISRGHSTHWFLNLFPRAHPFYYNEGGYATLSFIPTLGTMILGLIAGKVLRSERAGWRKVRWLAIAGRCVARRRLAAGRGGDLPGGETNLDAELDAV